MLRILAAEAVFSLIVFAMQKVPRGSGWMTLAGICVIAAVLPLLLTLGCRQREAPARPGRRVLIWGCGVFAVAQLAFAVVRMVKPKVIDIGATTLAAVIAVAHGSNPYALPIDQLAGGIANADSLFHGYKYLPMMILAYLPLSLALGIRGIVATNVFLQGATAGIIGVIAARKGGYFAGLAAACFYLSLPFLANQLFTRGVTDIAAVLPLLLALALVEDRPGWAGLMVGLSVATKLAPGAAMLLCLLPAPGGRTRYFGGVLLGLSPILPFAATAPEAFTANIVLFNTVRPIDDTSWLFGMPAFVVILSRAVATAVLVAISLWIWRRSPGLDERCACCVLAGFAVFAVGPEMHHNYYVWFLPFLAILVGRAAIGSAATAAVPGAARSLAEVEDVPGAPWRRAGP
jgi:hypothetical protein